MKTCTLKSSWNLHDNIDDKNYQEAMKVKDESIKDAVDENILKGLVDVKTNNNTSS